MSKHDIARTNIEGALLTVRQETDELWGCLEQEALPVEERAVEGNLDHGRASAHELLKHVHLAEELVLELWRAAGELEIERNHLRNQLTAAGMVPVVPRAVAAEGDGEPNEATPGEIAQLRAVARSFDVLVKNTRGLRDENTTLRGLLAIAPPPAPSDGGK